MKKNVKDIYERKMGKCRSETRVFFEFHYLKVNINTFYKILI